MRGSSKVISSNGPDGKMKKIKKEEPNVIFLFGNEKSSVVTVLIGHGHQAQLSSII